MAAGGLASRVRKAGTDARLVHGVMMAMRTPTPDGGDLGAVECVQVAHRRSPVQAWQLIPGGRRDVKRVALV